jgi:hypothetical protein
LNGQHEQSDQKANAGTFGYWQTLLNQARASLDKWARLRGTISAGATAACGDAVFSGVASHIFAQSARGAGCLKK